MKESHLILRLEQKLFSVAEPADGTQQGQKTGLAPQLLLPLRLPRPLFQLHPPEFEDVFPLLVVAGDLAGGLAQADGHLAVIRDAAAGALAVLVEAQAAFPQDAVDVLPGSAPARGHECGINAWNRNFSENMVPTLRLQHFVIVNISVDYYASRRVEYNRWRLPPIFVLHSR